MSASPQESFEKLIEVVPAKRTPEWENEFLKLLPSLSLEILSEAPQTGPDSWPYLMAKTSATAKQPAAKILHWLSERGIGLAINPDKPAPDYVLSYGMVWNFRETGAFLTPVSAAPKPELKTVALEAGTKVLAGPPSEQYLPPYVRAILRSFFTDNQVGVPKILVMSEDSQNFDLLFSAESLGNPPEAEAQNVLEAISWFLPSHYSLVLASEKGLPPFHAL